MEELERQHAQEKKALDAEISRLRANPDGLNKKQLSAQIKTMQDELADRHNAEIDALLYNDVPVEEEVVAPQPVEEIAPMKDGKKPNKSKLKKQKKQEKMDAVRQKAEEEAANMTDYSKLEEEELLKILNVSKLTLHDIAPDGHCLFNSVSHQLKLTGSVPYTYQQLRKMCADYMRKHSDEFMPFLLNDAGDLYTSDAYATYCDELEAKAIWGGHLEIQALTKVLKRQIQIIQAKTVTLTIGEEYTDEPPLKLSYHRHAFGLGEHYNSVVPLTESDQI